MSLPDQFAFAPGKAYPRVIATSPQQYLDAVLAAERHIAAHQRENEDGVYWADELCDDTHITLYSGATGILYFYLELYRITGDERFGEIVRKATRFLERNWRATTVPDEDHHLFPSAHYEEANGGAYPGEEFSLKLGPGGVGSILLRVYQRYPSDELRATLEDIGRYLDEHAVKDEKGARWSGNTGVYLDGGSFLYLALLFEEFHDKAIGELIDGYGRYLLSTIQEQPDDTVIADGTNLYRSFSMPNQEAGTSGGGYQLSRLYQLTGDERYLKAAEGAARYIEKIAVPQDKGYLIPARIEGDGTVFRGNSDLSDPAGDGSTQHGDLPVTYTNPLFYLGDCNGVAGTSRLFYNLYAITGDRTWLDPVYALTDGLESIGAPEHQSAGLWNGSHYCDGLSSVLPYFAGMAVVTGEDRWRDLVKRTADVLLGVAEHRTGGDGEDEIVWPVAWERIWPNDLSVSLGLYTGSAGIAAALLQAYALLDGRFTWDRLADDPWPTEASRR